MGVNRGPISALDRVFVDEAPVNEADRLEVTITFDGMDARFVRMEAASRGISPRDMAQILVQQGMFFWNSQSG